VQDRARTLFRSGVAISDPHAPMEFSTSSKKLIGRVLLNSEDDAPALCKPYSRRPKGKSRSSDTMEPCGQLGGAETWSQAT